MAKAQRIAHRAPRRQSASVGVCRCLSVSADVSRCQPMSVARARRPSSGHPGRTIQLMQVGKTPRRPRSPRRLSRQASGPWVVSMTCRMTLLPCLVTVVIDVVCCFEGARRPAPQPSRESGLASIHEDPVTRRAVAHRGRVCGVAITCRRSSPTRERSPSERCRST
jgi:hypothetical protein